MQSGVWRLAAGLVSLGGWQFVRRRFRTGESTVMRGIHPSRSGRDALGTFVLLFVFALPGCGGKVDHPSPKTYPVTGRVVASHGELPAGSTIQFQPQDPALTAQGRIEADGSFTLAILFQGKILTGATEGPHHVTVLPPITLDRSGKSIVLKESYTVEPKENHMIVKLDN